MKKKYKIRKGSLAWHCRKIVRCIRKNRKLIVAAAVLVAIIVADVCFGGVNEPSQANTQPQTEKPSETIFRTFEPQSVEEMICMECEEYGVDAELAIAIAILETGNFTSAAYTEGNNVGGLSINEEPLEFKDLERGVEAFVMNLYHNYIAEGLVTVEDIAAKYCPVNAELWAEQVTAIMEG